MCTLPLCEGSYNTRLEYLKELPKGFLPVVFDRTDMKRVKQLVGDSSDWWKCSIRHDPHGHTGAGENLLPGN